MYTITEYKAIESKTFICMASKLLLFHISSFKSVKRCFTLAVYHHICIFSQPALVNLLLVFDSVMFCSVSVTFPVVLLQQVAKWSRNLPKSEALLDNTFSCQKNRHLNHFNAGPPFSKSERSGGNRNVPNR